MSVQAHIFTCGITCAGNLRRGLRYGFSPERYSGFGIKILQPLHFACKIYTKSSDRERLLRKKEEAA